MRQIFLILFTLIAALAAAQKQPTTKQIRNLQSQQSKLKKEIAAQEGELRTNKKNVASELNNLNLLNAQIGAQEKYVKGINDEVSTLAGHLSSLETELAALEKDLAECKRRYKRAVMYMHRQRAVRSNWQFVLSAPSFRKMYRRMRYVQEFSKYQRAQGRVIEEKEARVVAKRTEVRSTKQEKDHLLASGRAEQQKLNGQKKTREATVAALQSKQDELQKNIAQQRKQAAALDRKIDQLIQAEIEAAERRRKAAEEKRRREEAERRKREQREREQREAARRKAEAAKKSAAASSKSSSNNASKNASSKKSTRTYEDDEARTATPRFEAESAADRTMNSNFTANRGRLPMPITGSYFISTHFGSYNVEGLSGVRLDSKGINITGRPGAQARAVFKGEVTAVFSYGGLWNVIVRHGSYMSVYCNLASAAVHRGQSVDTRQTLGAVATDASGNCTLHFQLRKETQKLNPESWLGR